MNGSSGRASALGHVFKIRWVAQASGLLFRASRPKPLWDVNWLWFLQLTSNGWHLTKSGGTPDLTGATPAPPI
jgi:hypothetical protein